MHCWHIFCGFPWSFQTLFFVESCCFFLHCIQCPETLNLSYQESTIKRRKKLIFHHKGGPFWLGVSKSYPECKKGLKKNKVAKWNKKMDGRSCYFTSGAFGPGLLYSVCCTLNPVPWIPSMAQCVKCMNLSTCVDVAQIPKRTDTDRK